jgi:hypothetical protein
MIVCHVLFIKDTILIMLMRKILKKNFALKFYREIIEIWNFESSKRTSLKLKEMITSLKMTLRVKF